MKHSTERILTTHVGSLPRSKAVTDVVFALENDEARPEAGRVFRDAVAAVVDDQVRAGIDIVSDGEMSKISYATYIKDRITGFAGDSERQPPADLEDFPGFLERQARSGGTPTYRRPCCVGDIRVKDMGPVQEDISNFNRALEISKPVEGFMNAASPGVIALFQPNRHYGSHEAYLYALADAMAAEYRAITEAGLILQLDSPDLGLGRHMMFKGRPDEEYRQLAQLHVEALNHALADIPKERVRMHVCWGNYEGPHHLDAPMEMVLPIALAAHVGALLFESANPRHAHEWEVFKDRALPEDLILIPGVIDSTTNFIEHPKLVAERIGRFADIVGRERVIAGSDCGFSTFAGFGAVDQDIVYAKLGALAEGARIASERLWG
ncbi:MAG: cobalamin-independent methionine synthase II family protein [Gammaproteobacteria bacterium]|nr:cobalamin-independent methionine synthase II family protein [Gammaproteobacteria bacterium]MDD9962696.1 cobalamin-independent methionine synthase II family protein [Gammaproteobacteria bacterium]MDE0273485.1 cobalamin-independent methionine synthase II family protein [Gammaproteobacteria bacterium]